MRREVMVNPKALINTNELTFVNQPIIYDGFTDVYYKEQRIAIINGLSAPLQWVAKNGSNIPNHIIDEIENLVRNN